jgi:hypothetical protein
MTKNTANLSFGGAVVVAGVGYLLSVTIPVLSAYFIFSKLVVPGDVVATAGNVQANELLFRIGIVSDLFMYVTNLVLSVALYALLKTTNETVATGALLTRLGDVVLGGVAATCSVMGLLLLNGEAPSTELAAEQQRAIAGLLFEVRSLVSIAFLFVGLGATLFCYLLFKSRAVPRALAAFGIVSYSLILACAFVSIVSPDFASLSCLFEVAMGLWLLIKGFDRGASPSATAA